MANTIKTLIDKADLEKVYNILFEKHSASDYKKIDDFPLERVRSLYGATCLSLLIKPNAEPSKDFKIYLEEIRSPNFNEDFVDVALLNLNYEKPPEGLKPWGCVNNSELPDGYYNANDIKYSELLSIGSTPWEELSNMEIAPFKNLEISNEEVLANILWEITFYSFDENETRKFFDDLNNSICNK